MQSNHSNKVVEFFKNIIPKFFYFIFLSINLVSIPFGKASLFFHKLFKTQTGLKIVEAERLMDNLKNMAEEMKALKKYDNKNGGFFLANEDKNKETLH